MSGGHTGDELQLDNVFFWREKVTDGISPVTTHPSPLTEAWYSLDGKRLPGKPSQKGIYIYKGKKYAIQ